MRWRLVTRWLVDNVSRGTWNSEENEIVFVFVCGMVVQLLACFTFIFRSLQGFNLLISSLPRFSMIIVLLIHVHFSYLIAWSMIHGIN